MTEEEAYLKKQLLEEIKVSLERLEKQNASTAFGVFSSIFPWIKKCVIIVAGLCFLNLFGNTYNELFYAMAVVTLADIAALIYKAWIVTLEVESEIGRGFPHFHHKLNAEKRQEFIDRAAKSYFDFYKCGELCTLFVYAVILVRFFTINVL